MIQLLKTLIPGFSDVSTTVWIIFAAVCLVYYVLYVIGFWRMFVKAGEAGWKALIPVYNRYILFKTCWSQKAFINVLLYGVIGAIADYHLYQGTEDWLVVALTSAGRLSRQQGVFERPGQGHIQRFHGSL